MSSRITNAINLLLAMLLGAAAMSPAMAADRPLFAPGPMLDMHARVHRDASLQALIEQPAAESVRLVQADAAQVSERAATLLFNPTPELSLWMHRQYSYRNEDGTLVWYGLLESEAQTLERQSRFGDEETADDPMNSVMLVRNGNKLSGNLRVAGEWYAIRPLRSGGHAIVKMDQARMPPDHPQDAAGLLRKRLPQSVPAAAGSADDRIGPAVANTILRVMVVVTQAASTASGDPAGMVALAIAESNQGYANSGVHVHLMLAARYTTTYVESGFNTDLDRFTAYGDGYMDGYHVKRRQTRADLGVLIINDSSSCGLGWLNSNAAYAFSAVHYTCATGYYSFAHEIGHNFGAHHAPGDGGTPNPYYSYGHGYKDPAGGWRTIMAYDCTAGCARLNYWSNPYKRYNGVRMGTLTTSYNARVLNERRAAIAAFR